MEWESESVTTKHFSHIVECRGPPPRMLGNVFLAPSSREQQRCGWWWFWLCIGFRWICHAQQRLKSVVEEDGVEVVGKSNYDFRGFFMRRRRKEKTPNAAATISRLNDAGGGRLMWRRCCCLTMMIRYAVQKCGRSLEWVLKIFRLLIGRLKTFCDSCFCRMAARESSGQLRGRQSLNFEYCL